VDQSTQKTAWITRQKNTDGGTGTPGKQTGSLIALVTHLLSRTPDDFASTFSHFLIGVRIERAGNDCPRKSGFVGYIL
jgi:hypothetical protein